MGPSLLMNCQWSRPAARKGDALRLVAVEKAWISAPLEHRCELPGEVDGVSDADVHALLADGVNGARNFPNYGEVKFPSLAGGVIRRRFDRGLRFLAAVRDV